ncbi:OPT superfamily [Cryomyces antarcticus]|nr:OPT superfamily [Cryomyces antarcticus]
MGVRALGETDLNPVSGISKLTQLFFAFATPKGNKNAVIINLLAGAISESAALQAGDLLQDLKTGHLLGAAPKAQFYGQLIGSAVGAVVSAAVYKLYTHVYEVPGGYVWIFTARLVTGQGETPKSPERDRERERERPMREVGPKSSSLDHMPRSTADRHPTNTPSSPPSFLARQTLRSPWGDTPSVLLVVLVLCKRASAAVRRTGTGRLLSAGASATTRGDQASACRDAAMGVLIEGWPSFL